MNDKLQDDLLRDLRTGASILASGDTGWEMVNHPEPILYVLARRSVASSNDWIPGADLVEDLVSLRREDSNNFNPHGWFGKALTDVRGGKKGAATTLGRWAAFVQRSEKKPYRYRFEPELYEVLKEKALDVLESLPAPPSGEPPAERRTGGKRSSVTSAVGFIYETHLQDYIEGSWPHVSRTLNMADFELMERDCGDAGTADIVARSPSTGEWVVIELKRGEVVDVAIAQVARYMSWVREHRAAGAPVRGIVAGRQFDERTRLSAKAVPGVTLWKYAIAFNFEPDAPV